MISAVPALLSLLWHSLFSMYDVTAGVSVGGHNVRNMTLMFFPVAIAAVLQERATGGTIKENLLGIILMLLMVLEAARLAAERTALFQTFDMKLILSRAATLSRRLKQRLCIACWETSKVLILDDLPALLIQRLILIRAGPQRLSATIPPRFNIAPYISIEGSFKIIVLDNGQS